MKTFNIYLYLFCLLLLTATMACTKSTDTEPKPEPEPKPSTQNDIAALDNSVKAYMEKYNVPGLSLAITKGEKLVYIKAYGKADKEADQNLTTQHKFRVASLSKSITGIAFMKLVEQGKLSLSDKVFGTNGLLGTQYGSKAYTANIQAITVAHLLQHTAGGWNNQNNDPMFTNPTMTAEQLITWTLDNRPLSRAPGIAYDYSNFGYCILGRIVEKVTGKSYEQYVKDEILKPIGITDMHIGGNTLIDRKPNEVKYYGSSTGGTNPYIYNVARMDAHGGWIASAKDLMRLLVHVDGFSAKKDMLTSTSISTMTTPPALALISTYGLGWSINAAGHWWHTGSIPGTSAIWVRTSAGYNWAVLTNMRAGGNEMNDLDALIWNVINQAPPWQDIDQF